MATPLTADILLPPGDLRSNNSTAQTTVGSRAVSGDGREFRYAYMGAVAGVPGKLYQAPAEQTTAQDLAVAAAAVGDLTVTTTTTLTVTANQYAGGWMMVTVTPGQGYQYKIKSHPAVTTSALTLTLEDPIQGVALTTASRIDLVASPYSLVVVNPTSATSAPVGACVYPITINYYGWLQTKGPCNLLADGTVVVGTSVVASNATAGAVEAATGVQALVGTALTGIATTEYGAIMLNLE